MMKSRFRGYMPVVIDVETAGLDPQKNSLLQLATAFINIDKDNRLSIDQILNWDIYPATDTVIDKYALSITKIDPFSDKRNAIEEPKALASLFTKTFEYIKRYECSKAVLVGHNASFDLSFLLAAAKRSNIKNIPFHSFSIIDTASLSMMSCSHNVLAVACDRMGIEFSPSQAHNAVYDTLKTAQLFCSINNQWFLLDS